MVSQPERPIWLLFWLTGQPYPQHGCWNFLPRYIETATRPPIPPGTLREPKYAQPARPPVRPAPAIGGARRCSPSAHSPAFLLRPTSRRANWRGAPQSQPRTTTPETTRRRASGIGPRHPAARCSYLLFWLRSTAPSQIVPGLPSPRVLVMNGDQSTDHAEARGVERRATCRHGGGALKTRVTY